MKVFEVTIRESIDYSQEFTRDQLVDLQPEWAELSDRELLLRLEANETDFDPVDDMILAPPGRDGVVVGTEVSVTQKEVVDW